MKIYITGGAGFIGSNCADHYLKDGHEVIIFDDLSRPGSRLNLEWLQAGHGKRLDFIEGDVRSYEAVADSVVDADVVIHLASQVAVTSSIEDPRTDFEINALGTLNVLEAVRHNCPTAILIYASTNKVYGSLSSVRIVEGPSRYEFAEFTDGIPENFPVDFHSPYGCSKGAGDQYVIDYARIYGLRSVSIRQSCIYGERQFGVEDQGWIAHMMITALQDRPITIFGDGKQVRDVLHVSDLIRAYDKVIQRADEMAGAAVNIGGGIANTLSIWSEFGPMLESLVDHPLKVKFDDVRPGDQLIYVSDNWRALSLLDWKPQVSVKEGIEALFQWIKANSALFSVA